MSAVTELVNLELFKEHVRISSDLEDRLLVHYLDVAVGVAEKITGTDFISKVKTKTYKINQVVDADIKLTDIVSVTGYYTTLEQVADAYTYFIEYQKGIIINRDYPINYDNLQAYTIAYNVTVNPTDVPAEVKQALLVIAAELYANRENSGAEIRASNNINYKLLLAPFRKHI